MNGTNETEDKGGGFVWNIICNINSAKPTILAFLLYKTLTAMWLPFLINIKSKHNKSIIREKRVSLDRTTL